MKNSSLLLVLAIALAPSARAASPREDFKAAVAAVQKAPGDAALRKKVIELSKLLKPALAVPAEAKKPFVMAATYQKEAKAPADYMLAVDAYREALKIAPWWGDAYYNLSVALESNGKIAEAKEALELYLLTKPKDAEAAEERLFALEAKEKLAAAQADRARRDLRGRWGNGMMGFEIVEEKGSLRIVPGKLFGRLGQWSADEESISGTSVSFAMEQPDCRQCYSRFTLALSEDGNSLTGTIWHRSRNTTEPAMAYKREP